ncbi:hypothetical protein [Paracoccus sp. (in: a-proteobacteria)]
MLKCDESLAVSVVQQKALSLLSVSCSALMQVKRASAILATELYAYMPT